MDHQNDHQRGAETPWLTVMVVDDDDTCREAMARALKQRFEDVRAFRRATDLFDAIADDTRACVVVDLGLPDMSGHRVMAELSSRELLLPTVFVSGNARADDAARAMRLGAIDFLEKPFRGSELADRVQLALEVGEQRESRARFMTDISGRIALLAPRERQVMHMVCDGMPTKAIAVRLDISPKTVEVHRSRITKVMGIESVPQLVRIVTEFKLASRDERSFSMSAWNCEAGDQC